MSRYICVDFDGTCVDHMFPLLGKDVPYAVETLKYLVKDYKLILWTMRSNTAYCSYLDDAINWFKQIDIPLFAVNENPDQIPWSNSNKAYANIYIDDAALGTKLIQFEGFNRPCVDWKWVQRELNALSI